MQGEDREVNLLFVDNRISMLGANSDSYWTGTNHKLRPLHNMCACSVGIHYSLIISPKQKKYLVYNNVK